jgi:hypothetical protein
MQRLPATITNPISTHDVTRCSKRSLREPIPADFWGMALRQPSRRHRAFAPVNMAGNVFIFVPGTVAARLDYDLAVNQPKLDREATNVNSKPTWVGAHGVSIRATLIGSNGYPLRALCFRLEQRPRVQVVKARELTKIFQVFVRNLEGKSIAINNLTGLTSVEDLKLKLKLKEKTVMRSVAGAQVPQWVAP